MIAGTTVKLDPQDIRAYASLRGQLGPRALSRFKSLTEGACVPLHLRDRQGGRAEISIYAVNAAGEAPGALSLPADVSARAAEIVAEENAKLRAQGIGKEWIDGEKLAVQCINVMPGTITMGVSVLRWSEILAMKGLPFDEVAGMRAFKLDTNTHVIADDNGTPMLLVGQRGRKPGDPRMGSEALLAPKKGSVQWTLATNGTLDLEVMAAVKDKREAWKLNSRKELGEELGVSETHGLTYLGLMVDPKMFVGALGIVGVIKTGMSPVQVDEKRKEAKHGIEVPVLDAIALEKGPIADYLRKNRDSMVPQLVTGLAMLGYSLWGNGFLRQADK